MNSFWAKGVGDIAFFEVKTLACVSGNGEKHLVEFFSGSGKAFVQFVDNEYSTFSAGFDEFSFHKPDSECGGGKADSFELGETFELIDYSWVGFNCLKIDDLGFWIDKFGEISNEGVSGGSGQFVIVEAVL